MVVFCRVQLGDRDLERDRVYRVAGEEVLAAAVCPVPLRIATQVEDRADVAEERVVALAGEVEMPSLLHDRLVDEVAVVRSRARPDVVRRRLAAGEELSCSATSYRALDGVAEERTAPSCGLKRNSVDHVGPGVAVRSMLSLYWADGENV